MRHLPHFFLIAAILQSVACGSDERPVSNLADIYVDRLGEPMPRITDEQRAAFERGREIALTRFTEETGLGPEFNVTFCASCHEKPVPGGSSAHYRDFLLTRRIENNLSFETGKNGVQPHYVVGAGARLESDPDTNHTATRNAIPFFGVGALALVPVNNLLELVDPEDEDGDGISGRANFANGFVGRFGVKAQAPSLEGFVRGPIFNHAGITTDPLSEELRALLPLANPGAEDTAPSGSVIPNQATAPNAPTTDDDDVEDPELSAEDLRDLVAFTVFLGAPRPEEPEGDAREGRDLFRSTGCTGCHMERLPTPIGDIAPYTDMLVHDMGEDLADGVRFGAARGFEFRTAPLWGVSTNGPYLHDGRAGTLDEAILWHGGEAQASRDNYQALPPEDRQKVIRFLESLGGRRDFTAGLLRPEQDVPDVGELGGPDRPLSAEESAKFARGRELFDRDFSFSEGVGPLFNGDACRACHFDPLDAAGAPTLGGAGPLGLDVIRQGIRDGNTVEAPEGGTFLHRHAANGTRPEPNSEANFFERRQTPPLFGLGLIEQIPEETILANAMTDHDNYRRESCYVIPPDGAELYEGGPCGVAHFPEGPPPEGGELARFGWKADIPSLAEFVRDALSMEMGMTVPEQDGFTFGITRDEDEVPDPEISQADIDDLTFFLSHLAPPSRSRSDEALEDDGESVFLSAELGCATCHTPSMETADGTEVALYSDLLLHDISEDDALGIPSRRALGKQFRTTPLWGLRHSPPYMHNGSASTIEDAIAAHAGEAAFSSQAYSELSSAEREALLAFLRSL